MHSQNTASVRGVAADETGAVVPGARITLKSTDGPARKETVSASDGSYGFVGLAPGNYTIDAAAPDLVLAQIPRLLLKPGVLPLNLVLKVASTVQQVTVQENVGPIVTPDPSNNASALVLRGDDLQALSDDPDDLAADLQALAGPSAGPNGGQIYIDGFSGGQLPSKESIREIRVNSNPFSPEYDKLGFGRIEIFTKPGSDKFHGTAFYNWGGDQINSRNPYSAVKAPFLLQELGGNVGGPLNKRSSFFVDLRRDGVDNGAIVNAITLDPATLGIIDPFTQITKVPQRRLSISPRIDYQLSRNNTLVVRYGFTRYDFRDAGVGVFDLATRGFQAGGTFNTLQVTETAVIQGAIINEARFQYFHVQSDVTPNSPAPSLSVLGSFNAGGNPIGLNSQTAVSYEFQDYVSIARKAHSFRFGARLRGQTQVGTAQANFNGTYIFGGGVGPVLDANNQPVTDAAGAPVLSQISSIERYRRTLLFQRNGLSPAQIRALGGGATQFSITAGTPGLAAGQSDTGLFVGDDWRVRPNITVSLGLRYEFQANISDWRDVAPRIGVAWAPGAASGKAKPKTVIRAGFGMFYDRFGLNGIVAAQRYNGLVQQQYVATNPDYFPGVPALSSLSRSTQVIQQLSADLRAPYIMQSAISVERQLPKNTTLAVTYANSHGLHQLRSRDVNPGGAGAVLVAESTGLYNQNQLIANVNSRVNSNVSLFGNYQLNRALSNTDGQGTYPSSPYSDRGEYGPASTDVRNRGTVGGSVTTRWNIRISPFIVLESGPPFDITAGRDVYGTTLFNARPGFATDASRPGLVRTAYGLLDPNPTASERIVPRNYGRGPGSILFNLRLGKTIGFGPAKEGGAGAPAAGQGGPGGGGGGQRNQGGVFNSGPGIGGLFGGAPISRKYSLALSVQVRNVINHNNPGPIIGNITSPLFGHSNQAGGNGGGGGGGGGFAETANNRRIELQARFTF